MIPSQASNVSIAVILSDDSGAFNNYFLNVEFVSSKAINFITFDNINVDAQHAFQIPLNFRTSKLYASSCSTSQPINWIWYNDEEQTLYVFNQTKCGFEFGRLLAIIVIDEWKNSNIYDTYWVKLILIDNWNNVIESNEFNVTINTSSPPAKTNTFAQIDVYQNHYVNSKLPAYLFTNQNETILNFNTLGWVNHNDVKVATRITKDQESQSANIYVKVFGEKGCQISIYTNSSLCQVSEALIDVVAKRCASIDWFECSGPYESDCISCNDGYIIQNDGSCVRDVNYLPILNTKSYSICGQFAMIVTFVYIILSIKYGKWMLEPVVHLQTLMMLMLSSDWVSSNWIEYFSWIQYFKFDLGFFNSLWLNHLVSWTSSNNKFANVQIYWEETIFNYSNFFIFAILLYLTAKVAKITKWSQILSFIKIEETRSQTVFWILWWLILPFMIANLSYEFSNFNLHFVTSMISSFAIILLFWYWVLNRTSFFKSEIIRKIDQYKSVSYIYLYLLVRIPLVLFFVH